MAQRPEGSGRRRRLELVVIGAALALMALAVVAATRPGGEGQPAPTTTTAIETSSVTDPDLNTFIPLGVEESADGTVRFHVPACATDGAINVFWNVVLRDRSADLEGWSITAEAPHPLRAVDAGTAPDGFRTTDPLDAGRSQMREDTQNLAAVFRRHPLRTVAARFRLADLRPNQIAYRFEGTGPLVFAASVAEFDAAVTCDE